MNKINNIYLSLLFEINNEGKEIIIRNNKVKELLNKTITINPLYPIVNLEKRKFNWRYFAGELAWYLMKNRKINFISHFSKFWEKIKDENNEVNSNYGFLLFGKQLKWAYEKLKEDIYTRQSISFLNKPDFQYDNNKDFVCTLNLIFYIRKNILNLYVNMRSNDIIYGFTYDVPFFSYILQEMYLHLKDIYPFLELGSYYHNVNNIHYYEKHYELVDDILKNNINKNNSNIKFILKEKLLDDNFEPNELAQKYIYKVSLIKTSKDENEFLDELKKIFDIIYEQ